MSSDAQMQAMFEGVMDRLVESGWLRSYTRTEGKGFHLTWAEKGAEKVPLIKAIADTYRLSGDDGAAVTFDAIVHGEPLRSYARPIDIDSAVRTFWRDSIDELRLSRDEDTLLTFVHVIEGWCPNADTPVKVGLE